MTISDSQNVLVSAWNDSGAGRFMRLMDGAEQVFAFPSELLLGADSPIGIKNEPHLASGKDRWNVFRDAEQLQKVVEQEAVNERHLNPSESELRDWLEGHKFKVLSRYRGRAQALIDSLTEQPSTYRQLRRTNEVLTYIGAMKAIFDEKQANINLIHTPCAALDWESPQFWNIFNKVILIAIDPRWGFGNMHSRNKIPPHRYLERWLRINEASLHLKQKHPEKVLILCSSADDNQQANNIRRAHEFLDLRITNFTTRSPTLLGEAMGEIGFPFGGVLEWSRQAYENTVCRANHELHKADIHTKALTDKCASLYKILET